MNILKILRQASDVLDAANEARDNYRNIKNESTDIYNKLKETVQYYNSEQRKKEKIQIEKYLKIERRIMIFTALLWLFMIIATVVFCVTGNDGIINIIFG